MEQQKYNFFEISTLFLKKNEKFFFNKMSGKKKSWRNLGRTEIYCKFAPFLNYGNIAIKPIFDLSRIVI